MLESPFASPIPNDPQYIEVVKEALRQYDREKELHEQLLHCCREGVKNVR